MKNDFSQMPPDRFYDAYGCPNHVPDASGDLSGTARACCSSPWASRTTRPQVLASLPPKGSLNRWNGMTFSKITKKCFFLKFFFLEGYLRNSFVKSFDKIY